MIFQNRTGNNLNRRKLTIVNDETPGELIVDVERYDEPAQEGTQIEASVFNNWEQRVTGVENSVKNAVADATTLESGNASVTAGIENDQMSFHFQIPRGPVGPQGPQGIQGLRGPVGPQGLKGDSSVIQLNGANKSVINFELSGNTLTITMT